MNNKIILLSMAVVATGLFAMPSTLSLFAGQHNFVGPDQIQCKKCHQDIYDAIQQNYFHNNLGNTSLAWNDPSNSNALGQCVGCHRVNDAGTNVTGIPANGNNYTNLTPGGLGYGSTHTMVVTLECVECHDQVLGAFANSSEVHQDYYNSALAQGKGNATVTGSNAVPLKGANAACVGCHTHTVVTLNWTRPTGYIVNITENATGAFNLTFSMNTTSTQTNITSSQ